MASLSAIKQPTGEPRKLSWAKIVSDVLSPPVVWIALSLIVSWNASATFGEGLYWAFIYSFFVCIMPVAFIVYQLYTGEIGDIHMQYRHERYKPLAITVVSTVVAWAILHALRAPMVVELLAIMSLVDVAIISVITLYWQISMHAMAITGATMAIGIIFNTPLAILTIPLIVLVGAARLSLDRHTPAQVFAGAMVGALAPVFLFLFGSPVLRAILQTI